MPKEIDFIHIDFKDGSSLRLEPSNIKHLSTELIDKLDDAFSEAYAILESSRIEAEKTPGAGDLGVVVDESVGTKDKLI